MNFKELIDNYIKEEKMEKYDNYIAKINKYVNKGWDIKLCDFPMGLGMYTDKVSFRFIKPGTKWEEKNSLWYCDTKINKRAIYDGEIIVDYQYKDYSTVTEVGVAKRLIPLIKDGKDYMDIEQLRRIQNKKIKANTPLYNEIITFIKNHIKVDNF